MAVRKLSAVANNQSLAKDTYSLFSMEKCS